MSSLNIHPDLKGEFLDTRNKCTNGSRLDLSRLFILSERISSERSKERSTESAIFELIGLMMLMSTRKLKCLFSDLTFASDGANYT